MRYFSRKQVIELLHVDEGFVIALEEEEIIRSDAPGAEAGDYSERMLERARVAHNLLSELDVNLAGAAVIVRMREEMSDLRHRLEELLAELARRPAGPK